MLGGLEGLAAVQRHGIQLRGASTSGAKKDHHGAVGRDRRRRITGPRVNCTAGASRHSLRSTPRYMSASTSGVDSAARTVPAPMIAGRPYVLNSARSLGFTV